MNPNHKLAALELAAEQMMNEQITAEATAQRAEAALSLQGASPRRAKLVLPELTPAVEQDLVLNKAKKGTSAVPLSIQTRVEYANFPLQGISTPHPHDVLCGRGGGSNNHPGNEAFRELVNEVKVPYVNCPKREKPLIARRIVEAVRGQTPPGRFLSKCSKTGFWNDIGDGKAREKTSQALREGAPIIRSKNSKEAKKAHKAEKETGVKMPKTTPIKNITNKSADKQTSLSGVQEAVNLKSSMGAVASDNIGPISQFQSHGDQDAAISGHFQPNPVAASLLQLQQQQLQQQAVFLGLNDYNWAPKSSIQPRIGNGMFPGQIDSVPVDVVRRLLLGQIDPVHLARSILPPDEAALVAQRLLPREPPPPAVATTQPHRGIASTSLVSDLSTSSDSTRCSLQYIQAEKSSFQSGDSSSIESMSKKPSTRSLPRKKRKYIPDC